MKIITSALLLTLLPAAPLLASAPIQEAGVSVQAADDGKSIFGEPLYVNGTRISDMEIKRFLCYGKGRNALEARRLATLMQQEWELREYEFSEQMLSDDYDGRAQDKLSEGEQQELKAAIAAEMAHFQYSKEEYDERLKREEKSFYGRYPTLDLDTEITRAYQSSAWYREQVRQTLQFDDLFFKGLAEEWPDITREAIHAGSPTFDLVEDYAKNDILRRDYWYKQRGETEAALLTEKFDGADLDSLGTEDRARLKGLVDEEHGSFEPREDEMMMGLLRDFVMSALNDLVEILTSSDGLPAHILMTVEGGGFRAELLTEDVYQEMSHAFSAHDVQEAKNCLALMAAARDALIAKDALLSDPDFKAQFAKMTDDLKNTMFQIEFLALQGHLFPSVETYYNHMLLMESYRGVIEVELTPNADGSLSAALQEHMPIANGIMGLARAQAEVMLLSAFDYPNNKWSEGGWDSALNRALDMRGQVDDYLDKLTAEAAARLEAAASGENYNPDEALKPFDRWWGELLDLNSDYWDPPLPVTGKPPPAIGLKNRGRFQSAMMTRNDMKRAIGESSYTEFLDDHFIVDEIFFSMEPGTVAGPFPGPMGYYICYLRSKRPPTNPLNPSDDRHLGMIQEDFLRKRFTQFSHACLEAADVKGL